MGRGICTLIRPWEIQDWLYRFDPDEDSRGWEWWDATLVGPSRVHVWVDSWGESFFGCQELLWATYVAGAVRVVGPTLEKSTVWSAGVADSLRNPRQRPAT